MKHNDKMNTHEPTSYSHIVKTMSCVSAPDPISLFLPSTQSLPLCRIWFIIPLLFKQYYQVYVYSCILKSLVLLFVFWALEKCCYMHIVEPSSLHYYASVSFHVVACSWNSFSPHVIITWQCTAQRVLHPVLKVQGRKAF